MSAEPAGGGIPPTPLVSTAPACAASIRGQQGSPYLQCGVRTADYSIRAELCPPKDNDGVLTPVH